jgi:hypothetical protein
MRNHTHKGYRYRYHCNYLNLLEFLRKETTIYYMAMVSEAKMSSREPAYEWTGFIMIMKIELREGRCRRKSSSWLKAICIPVCDPR